MSEMSNEIVISTIKRLKKEKNAIILAHNYQTLDVQEIADFVGDSLQLAQEAEKIEADIIVFCGVRFMAETAKLLNPNAKVLLSNDDAGCPMADMIDGEQLKKFKSEYPGSKVICYVNSTVEVKAESDICCTSSNAVKVVNSIPQETKILFVPDQNLGTYAKNLTGRDITVWQGYCNVHHHMITIKDVEKTRKAYPGYKLLVHPECKPEVVELADIAASTKGMADYAAENDNLIIGTEIGLVNQLIAKYPHKNIVALTEKATCINMKKTSLRDVLIALLEEKNEISIDQDIAVAALRSVENMLKLS